MSLTNCLAKIGLSDHEAAIIRGYHDSLTKEQQDSAVAAENAVRAYMDRLQNERSALADKVKTQWPEFALHDGQEPEPQDPGSLMTGVKRQFDKQLVGAQQIGSDVARWATGEAGTPYSAYREGVNDRGRVLSRESKEAPLMDKVGEGLASTLETVFLPQGKTLPVQMMANAGIGGALGALEPAEDGMERGARAGKGAVFSGAFPAAAAGAGKATGWGMGIFSKRRGAAREIDRQFGGVDLGDIDAPSPFKDADPAGNVGPRLPKYSRVPGVQPTAGYLTNNQKLLQLEMAARDRNIGGKFSERDVLNTKAVYDLLDSKALSQQQREALRNKLNDDTSPLRIEAFDKARENGGLFTQADKTRVGTVKPPVSIDTEKDDLMTAIRKLGGINKESAQNIYGNELWKDVQFAGHPAHGPVWRNGEAGQPLDEIAKRLHEHGYLDQPDYGEMLDTLYEVSKGTADASRIWSRNKQQFGGIYGNEINSERDDLMSSIQSLVDELRVKNAPKVKAEKPAREYPEYASPLIKEVERLGNEPGVRGTKGAEQLSKMANKRLGYDDLQPEDLYSLRKDIDDSLSASGINLDEATNAIKSGRREAVQVKQAIDKGLNDSSGGAWDKYLQAYRQGKAPIREGQAFDDIIGSTKNNYRLPIEGSESRNITRAGLKRAATKYTYDERGRQGLVDILQPENRMDLDEAISVLEDMEKARGGSMAVNGSRSASALTNLVRQGFKASSGKLQAAFSLADALGRARGVSELDDSLLNPEKLQTLLDLYKRMKAPPSGLEKLTSRAARSLTTYGSSR